MCCVIIYIYIYICIYMYMYVSMRFRAWREVKEERGRMLHALCVAPRTLRVPL
jgi:hypothetical protein